MNLQQYVLRYGTKRLFALAILCGVKPGYMQNLLYTVNSGHEPPKTPSIKLAKKLTTLTLGELSMEGLATPTELDKSIDRPRLEHGLKALLLDD